MGKPLCQAAYFLIIITLSGCGAADLLKGVLKPATADKETGRAVTCPEPAATPVAHWDIVPFREFTGVLNVGVVAAHWLGIKEVRFWYTQDANYQAAFAGPPQHTVSERTVNPQNVPTRAWGLFQSIDPVPVKEYWIPLNAGTLRPDVPVRVRAVAVPNSNCPTKTVLSPADSRDPLEVMDHIVLTPNPSARQLFYADKLAAPANTECSAAQKCNTIGKVFNRIAQTQTALGRAEILLGPGDWNLSESNGESDPNQIRWLVFRGNATNPSEVKIRPDNHGWRVTLTSFQNMVLKAPAASVRNPDGNHWERTYAWFHQVGVVEDGYRTIARGIDRTLLTHPNRFVGSYLTDSFMDLTTSGPRDLTLVQHVYADRTGDGHATGTQTVVNYTLKTAFGDRYNFSHLDPTLGIGAAYHGDLYQAYNRRGNFIIQGARFEPGGVLNLRGIVGHSGSNHQDIGIIDTVLDVSVSINTSNHWVFSFCPQRDHPATSEDDTTFINNLVVQDSRLHGSNTYCEEAPHGGVNLFTPDHFKNVGYINSFWGASSAWSPNPPQPWTPGKVNIFPCPQPGACGN